MVMVSRKERTIFGCNVYLASPLITVGASGEDMLAILRLMFGILGLVAIGSCSPVHERHERTEIALILIKKLRAALENNRLLNPEFREPANLRRYFGAAEYEQEARNAALLWSFGTTTANPTRPTAQETYVRITIYPTKPYPFDGELSVVVFALGIPDGAERPFYAAVAAEFGREWKPEPTPPPPPSPHNPTGLAAPRPSATDPHGNTNLSIYLPDRNDSFSSIHLQFDEAGRLYQFMAQQSPRRQ